MIRNLAPPRWSCPPQKAALTTTNSSLAFSLPERRSSSAGNAVSPQRTSDAIDRTLARASASAHPDGPSTISWLKAVGSLRSQRSHCWITVGRRLDDAQTADDTNEFGRSRAAPAGSEEANAGSRAGAEEGVGSAARDLKGGTSHQSESNAQHDSKKVRCQSRRGPIGCCRCKTHTPVETTPVTSKKALHSSACAFIRDLSTPSSISSPTRQRTDHRVRLIAFDQAASILTVEWRRQRWTRLVIAALPGCSTVSSWTSRCSQAERV
jgi:hypothetical protein